MANDDATLRISLDEEDAKGGGAPRGSDQKALDAEWDRFQEQMKRIRDAMDPTAISQRVFVEESLNAENRKLIALRERERDALLDMMPSLRAPAIDMEQKMRSFREEMRKLEAAMEPDNARQMAEMELKLAEQRNKTRKDYEAWLEDMRATLAPSTVPEVRPVLDLEEATKNFELEMTRLRESMNPNVARQMARQEAELAKEREANRKRIDAAKKDMGYDVPGSGGGLLELAKKLRGTIGGRSGFLGSILDVFAAYSKAGKAGTAGGASGAAGGLGAAAGPVGIALAVFEALKAFKDGLGAAIRGVGNFTAALLDPSPDVSKSIDTMGGAISGVSDKLFYVSPILGIFGKALGETVGALGAVMKSLDGMVNRYATFNPQLAAGLAQADIRQTLGDIRRAQEAGPQLLRYLQQRTEMQQKFEDMKIRIMQQIMPAVLRLMELVETILPLGEAALEPLFLMAEYLGMLAEVGRGILGNSERNRTNERPPDFILPTSDIARFREGPFFFRGEGGVGSPAAG